ncbi:arsenate reductase [bacterium]|nr:arsenate reductase [bacterium]
MQDTLLILHNPRCGTSRSLLELLVEQSVPHRVVDVLNDPLTPDFLDQVCAALDLDPSDLVRTQDPVWKERFADLELDEAEIALALIEEPRMLQRPIAVKAGRGVIARPIERVFEL